MRSGCHRWVKQYGLAHLPAVPIIVFLVTLGIFSPASANDGRTSDAQAVSKIVRTIWQGTHLSQELTGRLNKKAHQGAVVTLRSQGQWVTRVARENLTAVESLKEAIVNARNSITDVQRGHIDTIEVMLPYAVGNTGIPPSRLGNADRGRVGLLMRHTNGIAWFGPGYQVMTNRNLAKMRRAFQKQHGLSDRQMINEVKEKTFSGLHLLVPLSTERDASFLERGNRLVLPSEAGQAAIRRFADRGLGWLARNVHDDGRLTYAYHPSVGKESTANNVIRQWLATLALERSAAFFDDPDMWKLAGRNIDYNLRTFFREIDGLGAIYFRDRVKLGAVAIAALAIMTHPNRAKWRDQEQLLRETVEHLWNEDGSFRTFLMPRARNDNQNFYPGEALYMWAHLYRETHDPKLLDRIMRSFRYYRDWHLGENRNPAFVPWHTQAYFMVWQQTHDAELKDFIFEMNDWLLLIQQGPEALPYADMAGRFYAPHGRYGPPHASSTGVYLEGLSDALKLARAVGDQGRAETYEAAIRRGFRSLIQLQFDGDADAFYVAREMRKYVDGGLRTTVYDNRIRCDNVQHGLMAALTFLSVSEK